MFKNIKQVLFISLLFLSIDASAQKYNNPVLKASEVIEFLIEREKLVKEGVKVILLRFDYLNNRWHVEISPTNEQCIDCFPSYFIENSIKPLIQKGMHG